MLFPLTTIAQSNCKVVFSGKVIDAETQEPLPFANVVIKGSGKGAVADSNGRFYIDAVCPGSYTIECSFIGYKTIDYEIKVFRSVVHNFALHVDTTAMKEVVVAGERLEDKALLSQSRIEIKGEELIKLRGSTLGEALVGVPGVYTLQSGPSIFKPVIHGLHSNRVLLFNNGVRQEGQQWGSEHAPEIDPLSEQN